MPISRHSNTKGTRRVPRALALPVLAGGLAGACLADPDTDTALQSSEVTADTSSDDESTADTTESAPFEYRSLDGSGEQPRRPDTGSGELDLHPGGRSQLRR